MHRARGHTAQRRLDDPIACTNIGAAAASPSAGIEKDFIFLRNGDEHAEVIVDALNGIGSDRLGVLIDNVAG